MRYLKLNDQVSIPIMGFGTWHLSSNQCQRSVQKALEVGYRHIDTAEVYGNQKAVGRAISQSGIAREEIFITSKVWRTNLYQDSVSDSCQKTLEELKTDYLDLYLIHWPNKNIPLPETLSALKELKEKGLIKAIGVSNFTINHLKDVLKIGVEITNNQVEFHPSFCQKELKEFCDQKNIVLTAYSPLGQGQDIKLDGVKEVSKKYEKSASQVILNWIMSKDIIVIPRSANFDHIEDNFCANNWELEKEDLEKIDKLNTDKRLLNPGFAEFSY